MYYLVVKNLGVEKCIDKNKDDIYENGQSYSFNQDLYFERNKIVKKIMIKCNEITGALFDATVYSD